MDFEEIERMKANPRITAQFPKPLKVVDLKELIGEISKN
jgi:hypothetical protein